jgi:predicted secreted protein
MFILNKKEKKMKKINLLLILSLVAVLFTNCGKPNNDGEYQISINETIDIELASNWSTGYSWYWVNKNDVSVVDTLKSVYIVDTTKIGAEGIEVWSFIGKKKGKCTVTLLYKRFHDSEYENKKDFLFKVK